MAQRYGPPKIGVCSHSTLAPTDLKKIYHKIPSAIRRKKRDELNLTKTKLPRLTCGLRPPTSGWRSPDWPPFRVADIQEIGHTSSLPSIGLFNLMITRSTARVKTTDKHTYCGLWLYLLWPDCTLSRARLPLEGLTAICDPTGRWPSR